MKPIIELNPEQIYKVAEYLRDTANTATNNESSQPIAHALHTMADKVLDIYEHALDEARTLTRMVNH